MTAGKGIRHSEFNPSPTEPVHFLQIWIQPERQGLPPGYEEKRFSDSEKQDQLRLIASHDGHDGSLTIHQDVEMFASVLSKGKVVSHSFRAGRKGWVQVATGEIVLNGHNLATGDGAAIEDEDRIEITGREFATEILLFDLP
jgi:redox-sensitive bicupin YhaK (pirin superfamily)